MTLPDEPSPDATASDSALALVGVSLCEASARLHSWSMALLWVTAIVCLLSSAGILLFLAALVPASGQVFFAWRLAFDRHVFTAWAQLQEDEHKAAQREYDAALSVLLQKNAPAACSRSMLDRVLGVRRLHLSQIVAVLGQALVLLVGIIVSLTVLVRMVG